MMKTTMMVVKKVEDDYDGAGNDDDDNDGDDEDDYENHDCDQNSLGPHSSITNVDDRDQIFLQKSNFLIKSGTLLMLLLF